MCKRYRIFVSREVEGSGIPEIKAIIAGIQIPKYLNLNTGLAKIFGLMAALSFILARVSLRE
jgi:hypothetical protein